MEWRSGTHRVGPTLACLVGALFVWSAGCARTDGPRAGGSTTSESTTTSSTWVMATTLPPPTISGRNGDDYRLTGAWVIRTDRTTGSSGPWIHLNRLPELVGFDGYEADLAVSPDGSLLAVAATGHSASLDENHSRSELYLASTLRPDDLQRVETGLTAPAMVAFSPDGRWIAVLGDSALALVPVDGGEPVRASTSEPLPYPQEVTWSPEGRQISVLNHSNRGDPWAVEFNVDLSTGAARSVP